jgi:hypothetical protein
MLRSGRPYANLAVYLPTEDMLMRDRLPDEQRTPGAVFEWEMRQARVPGWRSCGQPLLQNPQPIRLTGWLPGPGLIRPIVRDFIYVSDDSTSRRLIG